MSKSIRSKIRPMPNGRLFDTGWADKLTFEQISEDIRPQATSMLLRQ